MKPSFLSRLFPIALLLFFLPWATAQQGNQGGGSGSGSGSGNTGTPQPKTPRTTTPGIGDPGNRLPDIQKMPETIFVSGSVIQEDGTPPPFGTVIELDCGDIVTREATVDSGGYYGFQLGSNNRMSQVMPDASDPFGQNPYEASIGGTSASPFSTMTSSSRTPLSIRMMRCELRAQYPGYRSTSVRMESGKIAGYTGVPGILLYRIEKIRGSSVSASSLLAPKEARKSMDRATKALQKKNLGEAERLLSLSLQTYPRNAEALYWLGQVRMLQERSADARECYEKAIQVDALFVRPYIPMARLELSEQNWAEAARFSNKVLELDPISYPEAYLVNALANYNMDDMAAAERSARKGQRVDSANQYPLMHLVLANVLARRNDEPGSLEEMRQYLKLAPQAMNAPKVRSRIKEKEKLLKAQ